MPGINANKANLSQLDQFQKQMPDNNYVDGNVAKRLYSKSGSGGLVTTKNPFKKSRFGDGKKAVLNVIRKHVGLQKAKEIMDSATTSTFHDNAIALKKQAIGGAISLAKKEKNQQILDGMPYSQRKQLADRLGQQTPIQNWRDPEIRSFLQPAAEAEFSIENFEFLELTTDYKQLISEYDNLASQNPTDPTALAEKLTDIKNKANEIKTQVLSGDINIGYMNRSLTREVGQDFDGLTINDFKSLIRDIPGRNGKGPFAHAENAINQNGRDITFRLSSALCPNESGVEQLKALRDKMGNDDHLRGSENSMYIKANHSGTGLAKQFNHSKSKIVGGQNRNRKFSNAKQKVLGQLTDLLKDPGMARHIMQPYLNQSGGLTKPQLSSIIQQAERELSGEQQLQSSPELFLKNFQSEPQVAQPSRNEQGNQNQLRETFNQKGNEFDQFMRKNHISRSTSTPQEIQLLDSLTNKMAQLRDSKPAEAIKVLDQMQQAATNIVKNRKEDFASTLQQLNSFMHQNNISRETLDIEDIQSLERLLLEAFSAGVNDPKRGADLLKKVQSVAKEIASKYENLGSNSRSSQIISGGPQPPQRQPTILKREVTAILEEQVRDRLPRNVGFSVFSTVFSNAVEQFVEIAEQRFPSPGNRKEANVLMTAFINSRTGQAIIEKAVLDFELEHDAMANENRILSKDRDVDMIDVGDQDENDYDSDFDVMRPTPQVNDELQSVELPQQPQVTMNRFPNVKSGVQAINAYLTSSMNSGFTISDSDMKNIQSIIMNAEIAQSKGDVVGSLDLIQQAHELALSAVSRAIVDGE